VDTYQPAEVRRETDVRTEAGKSRTAEKEVTKVAKAFRVLRGYLTAAGIDQRYLANQMGVSISYVSSRITARSPWDADDMYFIMDMLNIPHDQMNVLFPKDGKAPLGALPTMQKAGVTNDAI